MGAEDEQRRLEIRNERLHRLRLLELRQARQGDDTPPEVLMEIASTRRELGMADALVQSNVSKEFAAEIGREGQFVVLTHLFDQLSKQQQTIATMHSERMDRIEEHNYDRFADQDTKRWQGQVRTIVVLAIFTIVIVINTVIVISIAATLRANGL